MLPLAEREIPIIADDYVDPEFGTGCVKITPAHDFNDYAVGERHGLPMINIFTVDARLNDEVPEAYRSLDRYDARKKVVDDLQALGLLERIDDHKLMVPRGDRSGAVVEPYLTDQWFVDLTREAQPDGRPGGHAALTEPALEVVRSGAIKFVPGNWDKTYYNWLENIEDWCISRQIWWGHRIPAWYDESGRVYVARDETEAREKYGLDAGVALTQDADVLDTWFSSALWPFSTLGWPDKTRELATFYPTSVLVTGFDIIFFWVARMIMMGVKFMGDVPFREVYVHGLVRDGEGQKMSKSKGNVIDPIDAIDGIDLEALVEKRTREVMQPHLRTRIEKMTRRNLPDGIPSYGTDALRFTFASLATTGRDIKLNPNQIEGYRNFCNKLWNATRYVLMQTEGEDTGLSGSVEPSLADRWIEALLAQTAAQVNTQLRAYRFDLAAKALYEFTWHEYCDWYLELSKPVLASETASPAAKRGTRRTLVRVLEQLLRLLHPFMPYITEELWQGLRPLAGREGDTIQHQAFPAGDEAAMDPQVAAEIEWTKAFILGMRRIRAEMDIAPGKPLPLLLKGWTDEDRGRFERSEAFIGFLARPERVDWLSEDDATPECATALVGDMQLLIPLAGLIDVEAEVARLEREIGKLGKGLERGEAKLAQPSFVERAPAAVVEKERQRVDEMRAAMAQLQAQLEKIRSL
jgi:valyl-tRNA synthetase